MVLNDENDISRRVAEQCFRTSKVLINPIIDWTDEDVWEFINSYGLEYPILYDEGFCRLGCIGCPMNIDVKSEFVRYPTYKKNYINAFQKMLDNRLVKYPDSWETGEQVFDWFINRNKPIKKQIEGQEIMNLYNELGVVL